MNSPFVVTHFGCVWSLCCVGFKALNSSIISWLVLTRPHPGWLLSYEVQLEVALQPSSVFKRCHLWVGGRASSRQRLWWGTERSGVSFTTLHCLVGGRVVRNTRANVMSIAILEQGLLYECPLKDLPPTQLCKEVSVSLYL